VKAQFLRGQWYLATVEQDNGDGSYLIGWLDGEASDCQKTSSDLRRMRFHDGRYVECDAEQRAAEILPDAKRKDELQQGAPFRLGDVVKAHYRHDQFYLATIERFNGDGTYEVVWFDGDSSERTKRLDELTLMRFDDQLKLYTEDRYPAVSREASTGCPTEADGSSAEEGHALAAEGAGARAQPLPAGEPIAGLAFDPPVRRPGDALTAGCPQQLDAEESSVSQQEPAPDLSKLEHWIVEGENGAAIHLNQDEDSPMLGMLSQGDVILRGDRGAELISTGAQKWLPLLPGTKVFRGGLRVLGERPLGCAAVLACDGEAVRLRRSATRPSGHQTVLRFLTGFGEPWLVKQKKVLVRKAPAIKEDNVVGYLGRGDVLGMKSRTGDWVELVADTDVRLNHGLHRLRKSPSIVAKRCAKGHEFSAPPSTIASKSLMKLWMLVNHHELGELLRPCEEAPAGLDSSCALSEERGAMYRDVLGLIHRRIYKDNLEALWEGDEEKLPSLATLERKLFEGDISVIHATVGDTFAGGAIFKTLQVRAKAGSDIYNTEDDSGIEGHTTVGYIDSLAAVPGSHVGSAIWSAIAAMDIVCVACHSILLESTVAFWKSRGLLCYDASREEDRRMFKDGLRVQTFGRVVCELTDLEAALPPSKLPLMVWMRPNHSVDMDPFNSFVFTAEEEPF